MRQLVVLTIAEIDSLIRRRAESPISREPRRRRRVHPKGHTPGWMPAFLSVGFLLAPVNDAFGKPPTSSETDKTQRRPSTDTETHLVSATQLRQRQRKITTRWARQVRQRITPRLHPVETPHFRIYSTWSPKYDASLRRTCEGMYAALRRRFQSAAIKTEASPPWPGKLSVFIFRQSRHFRQFTVEVDGVSKHQRKVVDADGYHARHQGFSYIVLNRPHKPGMSRPEAITRFYSLLVHEGTHAFLAGFLTPRPLPKWLNEGLADFMAADIVTNSKAGRDYVAATKRALARHEPIRDLFTKEDLTSHEYGVAQSLVRFLLRSDSGRFVRFVKALKNGAPQEKALRKIYDGSFKGLIQAWKQRSLQMIQAGS